jgi:hypothetical protein
MSYKRDAEVQTEYIKSGLKVSERLCKEEILICLEDYKKVKSIDELKVGQNIRYFLIGLDKKLTFRTGGEIIDVKGFPEYIGVKSGRIRWPVQIRDTIFFIKMSNHELKEEFKLKLTEDENKIKQLLYQNKTLLTKIDKLEKIIEEKNNDLKFLLKELKKK